MLTVDARGLSCPEPVLQAKKALQRAGGGPVKVLVSDRAALENISALAADMGWQAEGSDTAEGIEIILRRLNS